MNTTGAVLFLSIVVSAFGLALFVYGKRQGRIPQLLIGIAMMVYPYFVPNPWVMVGVAAGLGILFWAAMKMGW